MAETTIPNTGDPRVDAALARIRGKFTDLEDAMVIQAHLEKGMTERIKQHAEFIASHEAAMARHEAALASIDHRLNALTEKQTEFDSRLDKLVIAIGELVRRTPAN